MAHLPITHMTLYKHGVGYFERKARIEGNKVEFSFRAGEMNDILKSLTVIDTGDGQVLGVDYATPRERDELVSGCSVRLQEGRSLRDLLSNLTGSRISAQLSQDEQVIGILVGADTPAVDQSVLETLVSILQDDTRKVRVLKLGGIQNVEIIDERREKDLRFFLDTAKSPDYHRNVTIRLTPGDHDLIMSYVAPAPTWRVSYRIVLESGSNGSETHALLQGWGIFDNLLEEDLQDVSLSLVAGMPISFVYDLSTPFTPERPVVKEEARVATAPVEFDEAVVAAAGGESITDISTLELDLELGEAGSAAEMEAPSREYLKKSVKSSVKSKSLGELFEYNVQAPVTVSRGHSAMVPVISSDLECKKDLIYNSEKMAEHPVATLRLNNSTGLTIERGPVTVLDNGKYIGEAVVPFTKEEGELVVPYAFELGVKVQEDNGRRIGMKSLERLSPKLINQYFQKGLLDDAHREKILDVLNRFRDITKLKGELTGLQVETEKIFKSQKQIQSNMSPLSQSGDEGAMRSEYLKKLRASEDKLSEIEKKADQLKDRLALSKKNAENLLKALEKEVTAV